MKGFNEIAHSMQNDVLKNIQKKNSRTSVILKTNWDMKNRDSVFRIYVKIKIDAVKLKKITSFNVDL